MSKISEFADKQNSFNDQMESAISGLSSDINQLKDLISQLQNSPGVISPEDQQLLDSLEARSKSLADRMSALDALTPPVPPVS